MHKQLRGMLLGWDNLGAGDMLELQTQICTIVVMNKCKYVFASM